VQGPNAKTPSPLAAKKELAVHGQHLAYIDEGEGEAIVFQHGDPTSSYLWRYVMPYLSWARAAHRL